MQLRTPIIALLATLLAGGCGGGGDKQAPTASTTGPQTQAADPLALPAGVPQIPAGPADAAAGRTIRGWARALRGGDITRAISYWAVPAKVQNGTPVVTLRTRADVRAFNGSLSCGAVLTGAGAARGYTIATFRLTERRGGNCGSGTGHSARTAVVVRDGRITAWYRLPDAGGTEGEPPAPVV